MTARGAGVRANPAEAVRMFQAAADRGSAAAMRNLGIMYEAGQGVPADRKKAIDYYRKAVAAYHRAVGDILDVHRIQVDDKTQIEVPPDTFFDRVNWLNYGSRIRSEE